MEMSAAVIWSMQKSEDELKACFCSATWYEICYAGLQALLSLWVHYFEFNWQSNPNQHWNSQAAMAGAVYNTG